MDNKLERETTRILKREAYLRKKEKFSFKIREEVAIASYNNDLYICNDVIDNQKVIIYWGDIKRKNRYYEIYVAIIPNEDRILSIVNQGIIVFQERM